MARCDLRFAFKRTGITDRGLYKILSSHIHNFPLLVLGYNPGGTPGADELMSASPSFFQNWEHDYVRFPRQPAIQPCWPRLRAPLPDHRHG